MATHSECVINEKIMGGCNHPDFSIEEERFGGRTFDVAVCVRCGVRETLYSGYLADEKPDPLQQLKKQIPSHCGDMTMIRRVLRQLESQGWRWSMQRRDGVFHYSLADGNRKIDGAPSRVELEAISNAVVQLARAL